MKNKMPKWNHYVCTNPKCKHVTIARHDDEGVTPFIIDCSKENCNNMAQSKCFVCDQADNQIPHVIFFRPENPLDAIAEINKEPANYRAWLFDHYKKGGSLMRKNSQPV